MKEKSGGPGLLVIKKRDKTYAGIGLLHLDKCYMEGWKERREGGKTCVQVYHIASQMQIHPS